jgi:hypothetical protein
MDERGGARGVEAGTVVAAIGAIALLVGLFLDWYSGGGEGASAWTVFEIVDLLLALLAIAVLLAVIGAVAPGDSVPVLPAGTVAFAGAGAVLLVVASLVDDPPAAIGASLEEGIWISFGGALLIVVGAVLERSRIRLVVTPREETEAPPDEELDEFAERHEETDTREYPAP